jgi:hypothetical protein
MSIVQSSSGLSTVARHAGPIAAGACIICWRWFTGARLLDLSAAPRQLARRVHAAGRCGVTAVAVGALVDWQTTAGAVAVTGSAILAAGLRYRARRVRAMRPTPDNRPPIRVRAYIRRPIGQISPAQSSGREARS